MIHSFKPVPSTIASYVASIGGVFPLEFRKTRDRQKQHSRGLDAVLVTGRDKNETLVVPYPYLA